MRKQDHLLGLINSLNANEKRHFRLYAAQQQDDTGYLKLFDALDGKEQYNATQLSHTLNISLGQLHKQKSYLAKVLLKSLRFYSDGAAPEAHLFNSIIEIEDLVARRLYDYAGELLVKALVYAEENELPKSILSIVKLKLNIALLTGNFDEALQLHAKMQNALVMLKEEHDVQHMTVLVAQFERRRRPEEKFAYDDDTLLHIKPEDLHSKRAMLDWFSMKSSYLLATDQPPTVIVNHARNLVAVYEADIALQKTNVHRYIRSYAWLFTLEGNAGNYEKAWLDGEKLVALIGQNKNSLQAGEVTNLLEFADTVKGNVTFYLGQYQKSVDMANYMYARKHELNDYMKFAVFFNLSRALLQLHRTAEAVDVLEELVELGPDLRGDVQTFIRPMMILAQLDLGNYQVALYLIKSTRAWVKRQKLDRPEPPIFLSHAYAIAKAPISKRKDAWHKMKEAMATGIMRNMEKELHIIRWVDEFAGE